MKRLAVILLLCVISFNFSSPVLAQEEALKAIEDAGVVMSYDPPEASAAALLELPTVYALPGTFSYWLNQIIEELQLIFTSSPEERASLLLSFSQKRLAEGYEAIKRGDADAAVAALQRYQDKQVDLSTSLHHLDTLDTEITPYLEKLNEQLGIQQSLKEFTNEQQLEADSKNKISQLLEVTPVQRLAWNQYHRTMLLGETDFQKEATQSASPSATLEASAAAEESKEK